MSAVLLSLEDVTTYYGPMRILEGISDRVVALDHGVKVTEGSFDAVATHPAVVEAYLGRDPEALAEA